MAVALLETPHSPTSTLGPYRKEDYLALADEPRCELIYGRFYVTPSPTLRHQTVALHLWQYLNSVARKTGGVASAAPMDVTLADHSVAQPDGLYISAARRSIARERIEGAPDLIVEVLSPSTTRHDRGEKLRLYAETGVAEYWLVDPMARQFEFLVNRAGHFEVVLEVDERYRSPILPEIELDLEWFWREIEQLEGGPAIPPTSK